MTRQGTSRISNSHRPPATQAHFHILFFFEESWNCPVSPVGQDREGAKDE